MSSSSFNKYFARTPVLYSYLGVAKSQETLFHAVLHVEHHASNSVCLFSPKKEKERKERKKDNTSKEEGHTHILLHWENTPTEIEKMFCREGLCGVPGLDGCVSKRIKPARRGAAARLLKNTLAVTIMYLYTRCISRLASLCHSLTVPLCHRVTLSLSLYHCLTVSLSDCRCPTVSLTVSPSHCAAV